VTSCWTLKFFFAVCNLSVYGQRYLLIVKGFKKNTNSC
jgi:hypothetical protein